VNYIQTFYARVAGYKARATGILSGISHRRMGTRGVAGGEGMWGGLAIALGILATALVILAVAVYEGFFPESLVASLTPTELGTLGFLAIAGAAASAYAASRQKGRRRTDG
jgi:hypothetical protein